MRTLSASAFAGVMILSPLCVAQSIFDGTWRPDPQKSTPGQKTAKKDGKTVAEMKVVV
jgi:hypothetical protein